MFRIKEHTPIHQNVNRMVVEAAEVARKAQPGQFIILRKDETSERIPLTIADSDPQQGTITLIYQKVGKSTMELAEMQVGEQIRNFVGPLGNPSEIRNYGEVVLVAGGVGIAPMYPIARALHAAGNRITLIMGARSAGLLFWQEKMEKVADELILCTDDGSAGYKGLITEPLNAVLQKNPKITQSWVIGPAIMMKFCCQTLKDAQIPVCVSLDSIMVDGTGMCGACRVEIGGRMMYTCVDGPEFDGALVNWDLVLARKKQFNPEEQAAMIEWQNEQKSHVCNLDKLVHKQEEKVYAGMDLPLAG
jgi:ferredoxin--NADP+ reductase